MEKLSEHVRLPLCLAEDRQEIVKDPAGYQELSNGERRLLAVMAKSYRAPAASAMVAEWLLFKPPSKSPCTDHRTAWLHVLSRV